MPARRCQLALSGIHTRHLPAAGASAIIARPKIAQDSLFAGVPVHSDAAPRRPTSRALTRRAPTDTRFLRCLPRRWRHLVSPIAPNAASAGSTSGQRRSTKRLHDARRAFPATTIISKARGIIEDRFWFRTQNARKKRRRLAAVTFHHPIRLLHPWDRTRLTDVRLKDGDPAQGSGALLAKSGFSVRP